MYQNNMPRADPAFVGLEDCTIRMALFTKKNTKFTLMWFWPCIVV